MIFTKISSNLESMGFDRIESKVLTVLLMEEKLVSGRDIERKTDIRQPEMSIAGKNLELNGYIRSKRITSIGKGRPEKGFILNGTVEDFMSKVCNDLELQHAAGMKVYMNMTGLLCNK